MRLFKSASIRTNLFVFFLTILGLTAGRRLLRAVGILAEQGEPRTHASGEKGDQQKTG